MSASALREGPNQAARVHHRSGYLDGRVAASCRCTQSRTLIVRSRGRKSGIRGSNGSSPRLLAWFSSALDLNPTLDIQRRASVGWSCSATFFGMIFFATPSLAWLALVSTFSLATVFGKGRCNLNFSHMHKDASRLHDFFARCPGRPVPQAR